MIDTDTSAADRAPCLCGHRRGEHRPPFGCLYDYGSDLRVFCPCLWVPGEEPSRVALRMEEEP